MQEKRKYKRIKANFGILCKEFRRIDLDTEISRILDISKGGVSFLANHQLLEGDILQMILRIPPHFKEKVELFGRVVASEQDQEALFKTRVAFIEMDPLAKTILSRMTEQDNSPETPKTGN